MKNSTRIFVVCSLLMLAFCSSCGAPNYEKEKQAAQQAMDNAKSLHAESLAVSDWNEAMIAWDQGEAAAREGKPAKTYYLRAKSRFEKTSTIAKSQGATLSQELSSMQLSISERLSKVKAAIERGRMPSKILKQVQPLVDEVQKGAESLESLMSQGDLAKAKTLAKEIQAKLFNTELIMAGKKPVT